MKVVTVLAEFIVKLSALLFCAMAFYCVTNDYYLINGVMTDFSVWAWLVMLLLWGVSCYKWLRYKKTGLLLFMVWLTVVSFAFDCWRLLIYANSFEMKVWINAVFAVEALVLVISLVCRHKNLLLTTLASLVLVFLGGVLLSFIYFSKYQVLMLCALVMMISLMMKMKAYNKALYYVIGCLCGLLVSYYIVNDYVTRPGIKFWEKPVTSVSDEIKVSVVVPVYNAEKKVKICLDSLRKQTLKEIEFILVNDGSTDGSLKILREYAAFDKRFRVITQKNQYIGAARYTGIKAAKGEYVGFMDNDDRVSENYFEALYEAAKKADADIAVAVYSYQVFPNRIPVESLVSKQSIKDDVVDVRQIINTGLSNVVWDKIFRRSMLLEHDIKPSFLRVTQEDSHFSFIATMYAQKMAVVYDAIYYWMRHRDSASFKQGANFDPKLLVLYRETLDFLLNADIDETDRDLWKKWLRRFRKWQILHIYRFQNDEVRAEIQRAYDEYFPEDQINYEEVLKQKIAEGVINDMNRNGLFIGEE